MKLKLLACMALGFVLGVIPHHAKAQAFKTGDHVLSLGLGIGSSLGGGFDYSSQSPAIIIQYEHGQWAAGGPGTVSLGGFLGFKSFKYSNTSYYSEKLNYTVIGIRSAYHYSGLNIPHLDLYGGAMLSYNLVSYTFQSNNPSFDSYDDSPSNTFNFILHAGAKYFFSNEIAGFAELSYGISYLTIGGSYRF